MQPKRIYIIAGESSGDAHGAVLMREMASLVPDVKFFGAGGPQMQMIAGRQFMDWTQEAVVGLWDVIVKYPYFREKFYQMYREISAIRPGCGDLCRLSWVQFATGPLPPSKASPEN